MKRIIRMSADAESIRTALIKPWPKGPNEALALTLVTTIITLIGQLELLLPLVMRGRDIDVLVSKVDTLIRQVNDELRDDAAAEGGQ